MATSTIAPTETPKLTLPLSLPSLSPSQESTETEQKPISHAGTPEEKINEGTHSYYFKTEFKCTNVASDIVEKFVITFSGTSVELKRIEPENHPWNQQYAKVSINTYTATVETDTGDFISITITFNKNGFTLLSTSQQEACGKYIRTLMP